jgi:hypothetical protein
MAQYLESHDGKDYGITSITTRENMDPTYCKIERECAAAGSPFASTGCVLNNTTRFWNS